MGRVLDGYREYLRHSSDPNLQASFEKMGVFSIFDSIDAWIREFEDASDSIGQHLPACRQLQDKEKNIPVLELTRQEYLDNKFIAPP